MTNIRFMSKNVYIQSKRDHIVSLSAAKPIAALQELFWNALDADAGEVRVDLVTNQLGGIDAIRVSDNGTGIDILKVDDTFGGIGGSWKRDATRTPGTNRQLHGRRGKGRFKAFALGGHVEWRTTMQAADRLLSYAIVGDADDPTKFTVEDAGETGPATGTEVFIGNVRANADSLTDAGETVQALASAFALYLKSYPDVSIFFCGIPVSPVIVQRSETDYPVTIPGGDKAKLRIIEWRRKMVGGGRLVFCGGDGFALYDVPAGVRPGAGFSFTAYLVSPRFPELAAQNMLEMDELSPEVRAYLAGARGVLKAHFRERCLEEDKGRMASWIADGSYPFAAGDKSAARRDFDLALRGVRARLDGFDALPASERGLIMRLLKAALPNLKEEDYA